MESLQSHFILTMSHWSSGLPVCFPSQGTQVQIPWGDLCETGILLLALSRYIGDPDVIDPHYSLVSDGLRPKLSLGPRANNVIIPLDLTQLFCPGFTLHAGPPSSFTTDRVGCWGVALLRACNLTSFSPCHTGPVDYLFPSRHKGLRCKSPGGDLCESGILLLALSCYKSFLAQWFLSMNQSPRWNNLMEKIKGKKSRGTIPLRHCRFFNYPKIARNRSDFSNSDIVLFGLKSI